MDMVIARTTVSRVRNRLGVANIDSDIGDEIIGEYITDVSVYIERYAQTQSFGTYDGDLVQSIATDLACARVLLHMSGGKFYGGADYRIGPWTTRKSTGGKQLVALAEQFRASAEQGLKVLGNASFFRFAVG
jgi:hypothetical protein